jgi:hypothetical protein
MKRQRVLDVPEKKVRILVWEPALRLRLCPDRAMADQLTRIIEEIDRGRAEIGVVPMSVSMDVVPSHGFWVFDEHE